MTTGTITVYSWPCIPLYSGSLIAHVDVTVTASVSTLALPLLYYIGFQVFTL